MRLQNPNSSSRLSLVSTTLRVAQITTEHFYALTISRPRGLKVKEAEAPSDPPFDPLPPPSEPDNYGTYDVDSPYDPCPMWLQKILVAIFCGFAASNIAHRAARMVSRFHNFVSQAFNLKKYFLRLGDIVPALMEHANDFFWLEITPAPNFAAYRTDAPYSWPSIGGNVNPFPLYTRPIKDGPQLHFSIPPGDIVQALILAGLIERAGKPPPGLRKYLSRLITSILVLFSVVLMLDLDWLVDAVERIMGTNEVGSGVVESNGKAPSTVSIPHCMPSCGN